MFTLICRNYPFPDDDVKIYNNAKETPNFYYNNPFFSKISESAKDLISSMLKIKPSDRISVEKAIDHQWFKENNVSIIKISLIVTLAKIILRIN